MVLFKDMDKKSRDLLTKDFVHSVSWKLESEAMRNKQIFKQEVSLEKGGNVIAVTTANCALPYVNSEFKLSSGGSASYNLTSRDELCENIKLGLLARHNTSSAKQYLESIEFNAEGDFSILHGKAQLFPFTRSYFASTVIPTRIINNLNFGAQISGSLKPLAPKCSLGASYTHFFRQGSVLTTVLKTGNVNGSLLGKITSNVHLSVPVRNTSLACEANYSPNRGDFDGLMAIETKVLDEPLTMVRAKTDSRGTVALSLTHALSNTLSTTFGLQFDHTKFNTADSVNYGIRINIKQ